MSDSLKFWLRWLAWTAFMFGGSCYVWSATGDFGAGATAMVTWLVLSLSLAVTGRVP